MNSSINAGGSAGEFLRVTDLHAFYGESHILHGVDFEVRRGEVVPQRKVDQSRNSPAPQNLNQILTSDKHSSAACCKVTKIIPSQLLCDRSSPCTCKLQNRTKNRIRKVGVIEHVELGSTSVCPVSGNHRGMIRITCLYNIRSLRIKNLQ